MLVNVKRIAVAPLVVALALARVPRDTAVAPRCSAESEVRANGESAGKIRYSERPTASALPTVQLVMPFEFPSDKPVTYVTLVFRASDITDDCVTTGSTVAKTVSFQSVSVTPRTSVLVALMSPASILHGDNHKIVDHVAAVYSFDQFAEIKWTHFHENYNDYRPIGCGPIREADCDSKITSMVSSVEQPPAGNPGPADAQPLEPIWAHVTSEERKYVPRSAEQPDDELKSAEQPSDAPLSAEQPSDAPLSAEQPSDAPLSAEQPSDAPLSAEQPSDAPLSAEQPSDAPLSAEQPDDAPLSTEQPSDAPLSAEQPDDSPLSTEPPDDAPLSADQPDDDPTSSKQPHDAPLSTEPPHDAPVITNSPIGAPAIKPPASCLLTRIIKQLGGIAKATFLQIKSEIEDVWAWIKPGASEPHSRYRRLGKSDRERHLAESSGA